MKHSTLNRLRKKWRIWHKTIAKEIFEDSSYNGDLDKTCAAIGKHIWMICKAHTYLQQCTPAQYRDYRKGEESYGYESIEKIESTLEYIADRFGSETRLAWLCGVPFAVRKLRRQQNEQRLHDSKEESVPATQKKQVRGNLNGWTVVRQPELVT